MKSRESQGGDRQMTLKKYSLPKEALGPPHSSHPSPRTSRTLTKHFCCYLLMGRES